MPEGAIHPDRFWQEDSPAASGAVPADVRRMAEWLDDRWQLPGTNIRFGLDGLIGLIPGIGDTITLLLGSYIVLRAHQLGASLGVKLRMLLNLFIDWLIGLVPLLGDVLDVGFKGNRKNLVLLQEHLQHASPRHRPPA